MNKPAISHSIFSARYAVMKYVFLLALATTFLTGCYSFRGTSIPPDVKTFYLPPVTLGTNEAPPDTPERFMEQLRQKIRSQSQLKWNEIDPNIEFECTITGFRVSNEGNAAGNDVSLNKLTITVKVNYFNNNNEEEDWSKNYSFGLPFDPSQDLQEVQDDFIEDIFDQISENIFNDAFTNW